MAVLSAGFAKIGRWLHFLLFDVVDLVAMREPCKEAAIDVKSASAQEKSFMPFFVEKKGTLTIKTSLIVSFACLAVPQAYGNKIVPPSSRAKLEYERNTIEIFRQVAPATAFITQKRQIQSLWNFGTEEYESGSGSGFLWDRAGHIVTNYHVIAEGSTFEVTLQGGKSYQAKFIGGDPNKDIAVLKLTGKLPLNLKAIRLPQREYRLEVGQKALAIGNPFGLDHTLTVGVISALGREMVGYGGVTIHGMIQTDASINPGNSGGPLLNSAGELIGMNTMIYSQTGSSVGIGFAVPVKTVRRIVPEIIQFGAPVRAGLGVKLISDQLARRNGIQGVVIRAVSPGSPAARAGLQGLRYRGRTILLGDIIVGIGKSEITNYDDLYNALDGYRPGDKVSIKVRRGEKVIRLRLILTRL